MPAYADRRKADLRRLRRIEGQVRGLQRMETEDGYCIDVLTQVSAATRALQAFALALLAEHRSGCVVDAARTGHQEGEAKVRELVRS
jgi:DNA-binding FrmR family transcriptional regulator